jgi:S1-C subfamily serine protease
MNKTVIMIVKPFCTAAAVSITLAVSTIAGMPNAHADWRRDSGDMIKLIQPISESVKPSVAQVITGGQSVSLATVVASDGYLLTKRSELSGDPIKVRLADRRMYSARVAAVRRAHDLALLSIDSDTPLTPIEFTDADPLIGSFLISAGLTGRPVGLGVLGVPARPIKKRGLLGVKLDNDGSGRAVVQQVITNSGAEDAGIEAGDLIVAINGVQRQGRLSIMQMLGDMFPGEQVRVKILRPTQTAGNLVNLKVMEMRARIRDLNQIRETENDSRVNGPRNVRLSGFERVIQHDTVLNPDQCGGPVLDLSGRVIGINIARAGRVVSYALPSSVVINELSSMLNEARSAQ